MRYLIPGNSNAGRRKIHFLSVCCLTVAMVLNVSADAQEYFNPDALKNMDEPKTYIGIASGVESFAGMIGVSVESEVARNFTLYGGAGVGGWGFKLSGGLKVYRQFPFNWAYCASFSHATGLKDFKTSLATQTGTQMVVMDLHSCQTLNLTVQRHWKIGARSNRFNLEFGLSVPLTSKAYTVKNGAVLTSQSDITMRILQPGGLSAGLGFTFGK